MSFFWIDEIGGKFFTSFEHKISTMNWILNGYITTKLYEEHMNPYEISYYVWRTELWSDNKVYEVIYSNSKEKAILANAYMRIKHYDKELSVNKLFEIIKGAANKNGKT